MFVKMLRKDISRNKALSVTLCLFIILASTLVAGALQIISEISGAMDAFYEQAKPIHYMQMVSGDVDQKAIDEFSAKHELVQAQQTVELLGIDNSCLYYGDNPEAYADSVMENSFVTQSSTFDFLLDENNRPASIGPGQVGAPVYAVDAYGLAVGDKISIKDGSFEMHFTVACFIRDSQMNASLVSSKRFLINEADYERLRANTGEPEYLIEFLLTDRSKTGEFDADYLAANLPSGITITYSVLQLMNAMTGGLSAVVLILAGLLLIVAALICLRFTILATLEEEYREIGVMKAIGLAPSHIGKLYRAKYFVLGALSCAIGFLLSLAFSELFTQSVSLYMGKAALSAWKLLLPLLGVLFVFALIAGFCSFVLRRLRKVSVVDAIRGTNAAGAGNRRVLSLHKSRFPNVNILLGVRDAINRLRNYGTPLVVFALCTFLIVVPVNFLNTLRSPEFIGYTGVGLCDVLITLRHSENMEERYALVLETVAADEDVSLCAGRVTANYRTLTAGGKYENISIQSGDFSLFAIPYLEGGAPTTETEIALSLINAREYGKTVGDSMEVLVGDEPVRLTVCGIYQDLTNGGKSAQAHLPYQPDKVLWYTVVLDFTKTADIAQKTTGYSELFAPAKVTGIEGYRSQTFASTIEQLKAVTLAVSAFSLVVGAGVTALFLKLILAKDRRHIQIMKGLGFTSAHIRTQYLAAVALSLFAGLLLGTVAANTVGELLVGALMGTLGAGKISFVVSPLQAFVICPALLMAAVTATTLLSTRAIRQCGNYMATE